MKLQFRDGTGSYVRGIEAVEFLGTGVRIIVLDLTSYPTKPEEYPSSIGFWNTAYREPISSSRFKQRRRHVELQNPEKVYKTGFGISSKPPQDCLFLLSKRLHLSPPVS